MLNSVRFIFYTLSILLFQNVSAQSAINTIQVSEIQKHLSFLTSDSLKGRKNYTPELHNVAQYIASQFKAAGASYLPNLPSYYQPFTTKNVSHELLESDSSGNFNSQHVLLNVIGVLPGKTKANEVVIFSAHYDHVGIDNNSKDSVFNGANDNASGVAAVLILLQYYTQQNNNARTLIFCAFAGEEIGLKGSSAFAQIVNANAIKTMVNIEMIGRHDAVGKNSFFITGERESNLAANFRQSLKGTGVKIRREPAADKKLFTRSDNYPFALLGVPAHTIMCSDDDDGCYHDVCDEADRIDIPNMVEVIKAITTASKNLVDGSFTPSRIKL